MNNRLLKLILTSALLISCAAHVPVTKINDSTFEVVCTGDDDSDCQEKAWKTCGGSYKTINDNLDGKRKVLESYGKNGAQYKTVKDYSIKFTCAE